MTSILSYNILSGGKGRINALTQIIKSTQPDIVGLTEANDPRIVAEIAQRLEMQHCLPAHGQHPQHWKIAILTRLPIVRTQAHICPAIFTEPVLEVCVEETNGHQLTVFVTHLTAAFNQLRAGDHIRQREVQQLLKIMTAQRGTPHLLIGDFNVLAPGDHLQASELLRYLVEIDRRYPHTPSTRSGHPNLDFVVPPYLRLFNPLLRAIPRNRLLSALFDAAASLYAPRQSISLLLSAGYIDCFRHINPHAKGFTCPAASPAGRIDFIFASPDLARRLSACRVITADADLPGDQASDHFPVYAEFRV